MYVNKGGRPLETRVDNYGFISTSLSRTWYPRIFSERGKYIYVYKIHAPGGIHIPKTLGQRYQHPAGCEIIFPAGIAREYIRSVECFELRDGRLYPLIGDKRILFNEHFSPKLYDPEVKTELLDIMKMSAIQEFHVRPTIEDFKLQSLCKLNKIPANITNLAMVEALGSLETVEGIEEVLNPSRSETAGSSVESPEKIEVTSPRVPRTSYRTSTHQKVKKTDADYLPATVSRKNSRGLRRQLAGEANEFMKTPMVSGIRMKASTTVQKETTVQSVYNTRRSALLAEKKCPEAGVIGRETSQAVKIGLLLEEVGVTLDKDSGNFVSENSVGSGSQFSTNANDDINNPTYLTSLKKQALSDTPASKIGLTQ
ncbi:hypothetical protein CTI12_AA427680 [Artemisia annua]|uniref:Pierisin-like domain-containing protein n=1 Tax=Artemisia annua TaxID=35608 RepID=A0A2U1LR20_ARTAN|nr:hypothetical protein CTI12_AA427680 [Artemisia annua]